VKDDGTQKFSLRKIYPPEILASPEVREAQRRAQEQLKAIYAEVAPDCIHPSILDRAVDANKDPTDWETDWGKLDFWDIWRQFSAEAFPHGSGDSVFPTLYEARPDDVERVLLELLDRLDAAYRRYLADWHEKTGQEPPEMTADNVEDALAWWYEAAGRSGIPLDEVKREIRENIEKAQWPDRPFAAYMRGRLTRLRIQQMLEPEVSGAAGSPSGLGREGATESYGALPETPDRSASGVEQRSAEQLPTEGEWSKPMTKRAMMDILRLDSYKTFNAFARRKGIRQAGNRKTWQLRLDGLDQETREKFKKA